MFFKIDNATKRFGGLEANKNVTIEIDKRQIVGLIGPNGAGKSTIFKSINGFNRIDEGEIYFNDRPISKLKTHEVCRLGIACTFQHAQLFQELSLEESVLLGAYCREKDKEKALKIAREKIAFVGLAGLETRRVSRLNMYQRKRAELAAALATSPELLLLDELFAGLVATEVEDMVGLVGRVNKELGVTLFIVEHVLKVIMNMCEKIYVLDHGQLIACGNAQEVSSNPTVITAYLGGDDNAITGK